MKFSELDYETKADVYYSYEFDNFRDEQANKKIHDLFQETAQKLFQQTGLIVEINQYGNLTYTANSFFDDAALKDIKMHVDTKYNEIVADCNEEYAYYSEDYDFLIDKYCDRYNLEFDSDGEILREPSMVM